MVRYSGANALLEVDVQYEYHGHQANSFEEVVNLMNISLVHNNGRDLIDMATDFELIAKNMEELAKSFILQNGTYKTLNLYKSVKATVNGHTVNLNAPARDSRGHPYAGHIEYGFTDKLGIPHGPWPFLRPAVRLAAADSRNQIGQSVAAFLADEIDSKGRIAFGRSGNIVTPKRASNIAQSTREQFGAGRTNLKGISNNRHWTVANHGIKGKSDDIFFHTSDQYIWKEGAL